MVDLVAEALRTEIVVSAGVQVVVIRVEEVEGITVSRAQGVDHILQVRL